MTIITYLFILLFMYLLLITTITDTASVSERYFARYFDLEELRDISITFKFEKMCTWHDIRKIKFR